nr:MAG TPA: hypothetical protein [Bacteriophage sp.]
MVFVSREPWVQFGPQLELQQCYEPERERRFPPRLVGYFVRHGHGFAGESLLYFKGEVILRHVLRRRKNSDRGPPTLSYWAAGGCLQCGYKPAS